MKTEGAVALVTGGARGLGLEIARHLSGEGATVVVADRNAEALTALSPLLEGCVMDVTDPSQVKSQVAKIIDKHKRIDILVNNAGVITSEPLVNLTNPDGIMHDYGRFRDSLTVNLDSVFIVTSAVVEHMVKLRIRGAIVNISSISACGNEGQTAYSAAKAGVNAMTVTWSKELGRWGIRSNAVAPGFIGTDSTHSAVTETAIKHIRDNTPLRRLGDASEVAAAVRSLIENDFLNGVVLDVNGGLRI
ncbi:SDR family NAD(P)-dependent oxidoreductase [uncultured Roseibium sp.]|uniref:SDR family NAD(P)-dependent oxidoreductase n=1 Tax=uncultured Roseibium sp. TaxID=1936171 RepID=UPI00262AE4C3|nr:SDR family NAD(P)-dependent oxidoreductase [uncultured Roseibium sp.]